MSTPVELFRDKFSQYYRDDGHQCIELRWSEATRSMSEEQFRAGLERLADFLAGERAPNVLVDVVNFAHESPEDFSAWRETRIIPRYNAAGVKKFAFLLPANNSHTVENGNQPVKEGSAQFPTAYFNSRENAIAWFAAASE
jgi:hypothetical protein